jgi:hypothetical protein
MMKTVTLLLICALTSPVICEEDIRSKVADATEQAPNNLIIDPDKSIFGIPLGTSEDEIIEKYGKPSGYLRLKGNQTAMIYGKSHALFLNDGKLTGIFLAHYVIDWDLSKSLRESDAFPSTSNWELSNGLKPDMTLADARKILGEKLSPDHRTSRHQQRFTTEKSEVTLRFSSRGGAANDDETAYSLFGVTVMPKTGGDN